jgi:predicted DCC family thiol-disulfide oxidoreductase YuxK
MTGEILLVYDPQCPVCEAYCCAVQRRGSPAGLRLVDARAERAVMGEITRRGLDIDEGMVLVVDDTFYYGADAIHALAQLNRPGAGGGALNRWLFGSARRARLLYPWLRSGRNLLLKLLGRTRVNNLRLPGNEHF